MRIHRTTPTRAFSVFSNALLRDRSLSWCAVGVLTYLLSLPNGARATIRTLAEQRKEGRARIASALHELEESRYLRRVVRKDQESGQLSTVYEVFDTPYDDEPPAGESEEIQNLASGESPSGASGALPSGEKTREEEPPSPPSAPEAPPGERTALAARLLGSLARTEPRLELGADDALRLAPLVEEWWAAGASSAQVRAALTQGLPRRLYSPRAIIEDRLTRKRPVAPAAEPAGPVTTVEIRKPGVAGGYREAARRGGAEVRALLLERRRPASA
uniref:Helix-turn-helix domain-containing protein n=1 Tax=Streptomyces sp. NBC_00093 TaxID=2975649 RepID=A0AAU2A018_9ACTN